MILENIFLENELGNTGYSTGYILNKLNDYCDDYQNIVKDNKVVEISATDVSEGKGYLSRVYITKVVFENKRELNVALKIPTMECLLKGLEDGDNTAANRWIEELKDAHNNECNAFTIVSKCKSFPIPKIYFVQHSDTKESSGLKDKTAPGMIMMAAIDGITLGIYQTVSVDQLISVAKDFAHLHDFIDSLDEAEWKGKCYSTLHTGDTIAAEMDEYSKRFGELYPESKPLLDAFDLFDYKKFCHYAFTVRPKELNATTFVHGDAWTNNIMFSKHSDDSVSKNVLAYIDLQVATEGNPLFDIVRLATIGGDAEIRREASSLMITTYYNTLKELYRKRNKTPKYSVEDCQELFDLALVHQGYLCLLFFGFVSKAGEGNGTPELVQEALSAKHAMRTKFALADALQIIQKYNLIEKFRKY